MVLKMTHHSDTNTGSKYNSDALKNEWHKVQLIFMNMFKKQIYL